MDKLEMMKIYMRVAELESFTQAAEVMGLPKASISVAVQKLESGLNARLLHRTTRKVQMTQDGLSFYERCKDLLSDVEDVENMFRKDSSVRGRIRIDMPNILARNQILPKLPEFLDEYPGVEFEISSTDRKVDLIREGFDCVLRVGIVNDPGLIVRRIGELTLVNVISSSYVKKFGKPKNLNELSDHTLVQYVGTLGMKPDGFEYHDGEKSKILKMKSIVTVNNTDAYLATCLAGLGLIQVPRYGIKNYLKEGSLVEVLHKYRAESMPVSIVYPHRRHQAQRVRLFMDWLEKTVKKLLE